jgi:hypothetical protein
VFQFRDTKVSQIPTEIQFCESKFFFIRPLLGITRFHTNLFCTGWRLPIYSDRSNQFSCYTRNCIRQQLLPLLKKLINPRLEKTVSQFADIILQENLYIEKIIKKLKSILYVSKKNRRIEEFKISETLTRAATVSKDSSVPLLSPKGEEAAISVGNFNCFSYSNPEGNLSSLEEGRTNERDFPIQFFGLIKKNIFFGRGWYFESFFKKELQLKTFLSIETKNKILIRKELEKGKTLSDPEGRAANVCKYLIGDIKVSNFLRAIPTEIPFNIHFFEEPLSHFSYGSLDKRFFISLLNISPLAIKRRVTKNVLENLKITKINFYKIDTFVRRDISSNFKKIFFIRQNCSTQSSKEFVFNKFIFFFLTYDFLYESILKILNKLPKRKKNIVFIPSIGILFYFF